MTLIQCGGFLEWVKYGGHYYGTLKSTIESTIEKGQDLVLEIDVHGCNEGKRSRYPVYPASFFYLPPSKV